MRPVLPTPAGTRRYSSSANASLAGAISSAPRPVCRPRTPQEISKPTPPAETTPPEPARADAPIDDDPGPPDLDNRVLCVDGACIGVVGPDGRCNVCGQAAGPLGEGEATDGPAGEPDPVAPDEPGAAAFDVGDDAPPDLDDRVLCADGACIGVVGNDGRCRSCGRTAAEVTAAERAAQIMADQANEPAAEETATD